MQISLGSWTRKYDRQAKKQGWPLFDSDGTVNILKIDDPEPGDGTLKDDKAALALVFKQAATGCRMSLLALFLDGQRTYQPGFDTVTNLKQELYFVPNETNSTKPPVPTA